MTAFQHPIRDTFLIFCNFFLTELNFVFTVLLKCSLTVLSNDILVAEDEPVLAPAE